MVPLLIVLFFTICFLSYSNGANDNFKGVATLFGSSTTNYRASIWWATVTTFLGSVASIFFAKKLIINFSGRDVVPDIIAASPEFLIAVAMGAGLTVMLATITGFPISTTHSLTGALIGSGLAAVGSQVNSALLGTNFFLPLLVSPVIAVAFAVVLYAVFRRVRNHMGISKETCICIGETGEKVTIPELASSVSFASLSNVEDSGSLGSGINASDITIDTQENCTRRYRGTFFGFNVQNVLDNAHFMSAGIVSFARGLNDTPKIAALLLSVSAFNIEHGMIAVAIGIAVGGLLNAGKVAETMSNKITPLTHGQGFIANIVTGILVVIASRLGMPVSTTHVSVGSIAGIGIFSQQINKRVTAEIFLSWLVTLPAAILLSAGIYWGFSVLK